MRPAEIADTIRLRTPRWRRSERIAGRVHSLADLRLRARRALPTPVWDYLEGGADEEVSLSANVAAFRRHRFQPRSLVDVGEVDTRVTIFERTLPFPLALAPTGYSRMFHHRGELEVAAAAGSLDIPYAVSTVATTSIADVAGALSSPPWLQLYLLRDRGASWELLDRAWHVGVRVLEFAVDTVVSGHRTRDLTHGFTIPPALGAAELLSICARPRYWTRMLTAPTLEFANLTRPGNGTIQDIGAQFEPALSWRSLAELRARWPGRLLVKGPLCASDATHAVALGVDGIHLSNHGGRQLDRTVPPIDAVESVRQAVPDTTLIVDSGIRHGMDIAVALALGADAVAIGRAYLYGLAADGARGVELAVTLLRNEFRRTLQLLGVTSASELHAEGRSLLV